MEIYSLDVETRPIKDGGDYAALEPWRVRQGKAEISSMAVCYPDNKIKQIVNNGVTFPEQVRTLLKELEGKRVFAHNAGFDVAWLITTLRKSKFELIPTYISRILWADTMLLVKWLINGQKPEDAKFSYSLANLVETFLPDHPNTAEFVELKKQPYKAGENESYWQERGYLDVLMTRALAEALMPKVPGSMQVGLMTEWNDIVPVANSWVNGIKVDINKIEQVEKLITDKMDAATSFLGLEGTVLSSPKQLGNLLFNQWGLAPWSYTPTKQPSTASDDIKWIAYYVQDKDPELAKKMMAVISYKENKTLKSKYIDALRESLEYTGDGYMYGIPKLFGTYTGRMTYSNRTVKDGPKVSIALHQLPRKAKEVRSLLIAPDGFSVLENDASGQESRLIAIKSMDPVMLDIFHRELNFHSMTAAAIIGVDYNEFMANYSASKEGYYIEQRQLGKLTNLSCNYRIGGKALSQKAFTEYDTFMTEETGRFLVNTFSRQYSGIPVYWSDIITFAKTMGYTECFGGRRYKIYKWGSRDSWISESSAINMPIQGAGASMKEIAISVLTKEFPETYFALDLHDATFHYCKTEDLLMVKEQMLDVLEDIDYNSFWGFQVPIPLPYESASGQNFGEVK